MLYIPYKDTFEYVGMEDPLVYNHINKRWYIQKENPQSEIPVMVQLLGFDYVPTTYEETSDELKNYIRKNWLNSLRYKIDHRYKRLPAKLKPAGANSEAFLIVQGGKTIPVSVWMPAENNSLYWKMTINKAVQLYKAFGIKKRKFRSFSFSDGRTLTLEQAEVTFGRKRPRTTIFYGYGGSRDRVILPEQKRFKLEKMNLTICVRHPSNSFDRMQLVLDVYTEHRTIAYDVDRCWHEKIQSGIKYYDIDDRVFPYTTLSTFPKDIAVGASQLNADRAVECLIKNIFHCE